MKNTPLILLIGCLAGTLLPTLHAQDVSLEEALDTTGINWLSSFLWSSGGNTPEPEGINQWHGTTEGSYDGEDSLYAKLPESPSAFTHLRATVQGPFEYSYWYKGSGEGGTLAGSITGQNFYQDLGMTSDGEWHQISGKVRTTSDVEIYIAAQGASGFEAWLDKFEFNTSFPPDIIEYPDAIHKLSGKPSTVSVEVNAVGDPLYKWFRNSSEIPGEIAPSIVIPEADEIGEVSYKVEVTDSLGTTVSPAAKVKVFSINEALDNDDLLFEVEDSLSGTYSDMLRTGEDAYDGEDAIYLEFFDALRDHQYHQTSRSISTQIEGPTILKFRFHGIVAVRLNGENPNVSLYAYNYSEEDGDWTIAYVPIPEGNNDVEFSASAYFFSKSGSGVLDQVELVTQPKVFFNATNYRRLKGSDIPIHYTYVAAGDITHHLLRGEEIIATTENERVILPSAEVSDSGTYKVRILNEFGEEAFSEEFEIQVYERQLGQALEQPDLNWVTEGSDPWISQINDTYDGEDAVHRVSWLEPSLLYFPSELQVDYDDRPNRILTSINGPAYLSFWWKGGFFEANNREIWLGDNTPSAWHKESILLTSESNVVSWQTTYLDRVQIEYLDDDLFRFWAFQEFGEEEVLNQFEDVRDGDRDNDSFSNLTEWALNKNIDFPNGTQAYQFIEKDGELYLGITFSRPGDLGQYTICLEASDKMDNWEKIESIVSKTYHDSNDTYTVTIRDTKPIGEGSRFIRLVITDEP